MVRRVGKCGLWWNALEWWIIVECGGMRLTVLDDGEIFLLKC